ILFSQIITEPTLPLSSRRSRTPSTPGWYLSSACTVLTTIPLTLGTSYVQRSGTSTAVSPGAEALLNSPNRLSSALAPRSISSVAFLKRQISHYICFRSYSTKFYIIQWDFGHSCSLKGVIIVFYVVGCGYISVR